MAHKVKGVDAHYSSHDFKELLIKYEIALPYLILNQSENDKLKSNSEQKRTNNSKKPLMSLKKNIRKRMKSKTPKSLIWRISLKNLST